MQEILNIIHKTIYQFFDVCDDSEEVPMSDKDKLLLEVNKAICNNLKALEQEPKWIPVSKRLPTEGQKVLCQCQANIYEVLKLTVDGWYHDKNHCYMPGFVIAWMPLPEPYKAESEEE